MAIQDFPNLYSMLRETVETHGDEPAYRWYADGGRSESVSWSGFLEEVHRAAKSLVALGVGKGDKVNILSYTCYRWVLTDFAVTSIGAVTVGIYHSNLAEDCRYIIDHSDAVLVFAEDEAQLEKLLEIRDEIPDVRRVVLFSGTPPSDDWVLSFDDFLALGAEVPDEDVETRAAAVGPDDLAAIVYTSGTTGVPKGAMLTHDNVVFTPQSVVESISYRDGDECFLFLPLAHVFARTCVYAVMRVGLALTFARGMDTIAEDLRAARPHWFPSVPRIYEKVYAKVLAGAQAKGGLALKIFNWACGVGDEVSDRKLAKEEIPLLLGLRYALATRLVFSKLQAALGGRVRWCISGAAPLSPTIAKFFHAAGVLILEGIGMTENTSFTNINRFDNYRFGWVGPPGPGIEQKVAEDGEILYRGRNVMRGYYKMPEETAETITEDGWQRTGDLGEIDDEGFLRVTGRKKDLIITAGGKNIAPSAIEGLMATAPHINQVCVIGDRRKYLSALVTLDGEAIAEWGLENGIEGGAAELKTHPRVVELIEAEVAEKNRELASYETLKKITLVDEFTIENGMLTPTMKVKRNVAMERYAEAIEAMY